MPEMKMSESLRAEIERDLRPVRPLPAPWRRALALGPLGALLLTGTPYLLGLRDDAGFLGGALLWGCSASLALAGLFLIGVALREAVPARGLSGIAVGLSIVAALGLLLLVTSVTAAVSPSRMPPHLGAFFWKVCFSVSVALGLPVLAICGWLTSRALPLRPGLTGALYGLGAGLLVESGWRLFCHVADPLHVLLAHGGAVLALCGLGALATPLAERFLRAPMRQT